MSRNGNYRLYADCAALVNSCLRDKYIEQHGLCVTAMLPLSESSEVKSNYTVFGDPCADNRKDETRWLIPLFKDYHQILNLVGDDIEDPLPLECLVKTTELWPNDTLFRLPVYDEAMDQLVDRYWKVIRPERKHLEVTYSKKIKVVPARDHEVKGIN